MSADPNIAFLGAGNMGRAIIGGLIAGGEPPASITVSDPDPHARARIGEAYGIPIAVDNPAAVAAADVVVLAVKPQQLKGVAREIAASIAARRPLVLSLAAGIGTASLAAWLGEATPIVRTMPNTPALIGRGATAMYATAAVTNELRASAERIMRTVGVAVWVDEEELMDGVTALSGSGPAYFFLFIECLETAAIGLGLPAATARLLALETAAGAAELARQAGVEPGTLRAQVTSPGGTTEQAIKVFQDGGLAGLVTEALAAAARRSRQLALEFGRA